jgi:hypothetical protein
MGIEAAEVFLTVHADDGAVHADAEAPATAIMMRRLVDEGPRRPV